MGSSDASSATDRTLARVAAFAADQRLGLDSGRIVVAVSGGADSLCLLDVLVRLVPNPGRRLTVAHVDHRFRPDSGSDADFVREVAGRLGLRCEVLVADGPAYARAHKIGLEHAGRTLRYRLLADLAARINARFVATGHTLDDAVESFLMHLLRGAGLDGLQGIAPLETLDLEQLGPALTQGWAASARVARPLLSLRRGETAEYCRAQGLSWRTDPTNEDPAFVRNRVRHHLLPVLRTYNPAVDAAIARTAALLREDGIWLDSLTSRAWRRLAREDADVVELPLASWRRAPRALRRRLMRRAASRLAPGRECLDFATTERALEHVESGRAARLQLPHRLALAPDGERLRLRREGGR